MHRALIALLVCLWASVASAQPATPCRANTASWTITTNQVTLWICASDGLSWQQVTIPKANVGLGNVDNTSDANKPVSSATQTALNGKISTGGLAGTATALATPRTINGTSFNGSADITVTAAAGTLTGATLASGVTASSLTSFGASPTLTTPNIGAATGTSAILTGAITSSGTAGIGYAAGSGGTVTQLTNKTTGVTLNKLTGDITMNGAALAAAAIVSFTVTNSTVAATDNVIVNHVTTGTFGAYQISANTFGAGSFKITVKNISAGSLSEAIVIRITILKGATS